MTATPALSSAPSRVVPSEVMMVLPLSSLSSGNSLTLMTFEVIAGQGDIGAVVVLEDLRLDVLAGGLGRGVLVGEEGDGGGAVDVAGDRGINHAAVAMLDVLRAERFEFLDEDLAELELAGRAGIVGGVLDGGGFDFDVTAEAIEQRVHVDLPKHVGEYDAAKWSPERETYQPEPVTTSRGPFRRRGDRATLRPRLRSGRRRAPRL